MNPASMSLSAEANTSSSTPPDPLAPLPKLPALDNTFGALLLGTYGGLLLFGLTTHQAYRYFNMYPEDGRILKSLVVIVMIVETLTSVFSMHICYHYLVESYFKPQALQFGIWSIDVFPLVSGISMVLSQSFFARRIWLVAPRFRLVVVVAGVLCLAEIGFFLAGSVKAFIIPTFQQYEEFQWLVSSGSTMAVTADTLLTAVLTIVLHKSRTGVKRTDSMIDVLIMYSVNTGLLTGVFNLLSMLFSFTQKTNLIWIAFGIIGAKMYGTTLLAALNSRQSLAAHSSGLSNDTSPFGISGVSQPPRRSNGPSHRVHASQLRPGRSTPEHDSVIELKATNFGSTGSVGSSTTAGATLPAAFEKKVLQV
ncbi:hypothetical protein FKP32DRAFT_39213 [Trametes sanguinea]|nr:hypothetical protein FKP32DRAFT_39213 [Trametes sanguinea]